jgi:GH24 family phage-related lysozyme (muramidase)
MALNVTVKSEVSKKLEEYEGRVHHLYLDSVGQVTIGVGHWIPNKVKMGELVLYKSDQKPASITEKYAEFDKVAKLNKGYKASWYKSHTTLVIKELDINNLLAKHIGIFYTELTIIYRKSKGYTAEFDQFPLPVQKALFDMIFNLGATKLVNVFKNFDKAVKAADWKKAAQESNRPQVAAARNQYVRQLFQSAVK